MLSANKVRSFEVITLSKSSMLVLQAKASKYQVIAALSVLVLQLISAEAFLQSVNPFVPSRVDI